MKRKTPAVFLAAGFLLLGAGALWARVNFLSLDDLSDKAISPQGRIALNLDGINWFHAETNHFVYHFTSYKEDIELYYEKAEVYYQWIKDLFGIERDEWTKKGHIFVFTYEPFWKKFNARVQKTVQAEAFTSGWELYVWRHPQELNRIKTLSHELTHVIVFRFLEGTIPLSLNEGFAEFVSYRAIAEKKGFDYTKLKIIHPLKSGEYMPLEELLSTESYPPDPKSIENFYVESESLVQYLILKYGGPKFYTLLHDVSKGETFSSALDRIYRMSLGTLERSFKPYMTQGAV